MILRIGQQKEIIRRIREHVDFDDVYTMARRQSYAPMYLVGGRVYRTVIEVLTENKVGASDVDWDFLVMGKIKKFLVHNPADEWEVEDFQYCKENSIRLRRTRSIERQSRLGIFPSMEVTKMDLIAIKDCARDIKFPSLHNYFQIVPVDIQCAALDLEKNELHVAKVLQCIERGSIAVNNPKVALPNLRINQYIRDKATSLRMGVDKQVAKGSHVCICPMYPTLMRFGCQCGGR